MTGQDRDDFLILGIKRGRVSSIEVDGLTLMMTTSENAEPFFEVTPFDAPESSIVMKNVAVFPIHIGRRLATFYKWYWATKRFARSPHASTIRLSRTLWKRKARAAGRVKRKKKETK